MFWIWTLQRYEKTPSYARKRLLKFVDILWEREIIAFVGQDAPVTGAFYHVPNEIDAMNEAVAKDVDVVLVDVLVANLEEPRASGG